MRCLLIDNYDSFSHILADQIGRVFGEQPIVVHNDQYTWPQLLQRRDFDCIVISPGPGSVTHPADFKVSAEAVAQSDFPLFGVCLGMQGIAYEHGGRIVHCPTPYHGRTSIVHHSGDPMFAGIPPSFEVVRYHSLMAAADVPPSLIRTAHSDDGVIQALRHKTRPQWGVQFHPESILSEQGLQILTNFRELSHKHIQKAVVHFSGRTQTAATKKKTEATTTRQVVHRKRSSAVDAETIFSNLFAEKNDCFWLDSQAGENARFSFMGCGSKPEALTYRLSEDDEKLSRGHQLLAQMDALLQQTEVKGADRLPFAFVGGLVGYFSYEIKALFGAARHFENPIDDMLWLQVDRFIAFDHSQNTVYLVAVAENPQHAQPWLDEMESRLSSLDKKSVKDTAIPPALSSLQLTMDAGRDDYLNAIEQCRHAIVEGESYEICLTNHFSVDVDIESYALYRSMRSGNAAPFGAYLKNGSLAVLSTSPERFVEVSRSGRIQARPIKGTCGRSDDPEVDRQLAQALSDSEKDRAENLMIVDLMRNDLSRVAKPATVQVPSLMAIESFQTVHQMVSTVEAQLADNKSLMDLVRATFPGGSISGAPKLRTMAIIDQLEKGPRGVYCGAIGYLGYNRVADLNIAIRTLSYDGKTLRFGAGGAITYLSDAQAEFDEIMLKAEAVIKPVWQFFGGQGKTMKHTLSGNSLTLGDGGSFDKERP